MYVGSHSFKIICIVGHRSSVPHRVTSAQTIDVISGKEDGDQGHVPWQTSHTGHFQMLSRLGLNESLFSHFVLSLLSFLLPPSPSMLHVPPCARDPHPHSGCLLPWATPQDEDPSGLKALALARPVCVMPGDTLALLINSQQDLKASPSPPVRELVSP